MKITKWNILLPLVLSSGFLSACSLQGYGDPNDKTSTKVVRTAGDEVKWISDEMAIPESPLSLRAENYVISSNSRLLIRLSSLKNSQSQILDEQPLLIKIETRTQNMADQARPVLRLCPITKNWMMLATWSQAHPYRKGQWGLPGGDFDSQSCLEALPANHALLSSHEEARFCSPSIGSDAVLCFDLKPWFTAYVRERQMDFGLILINESLTPIAIQGDSTLGGPSLFWRRFR